MKQKGKQLEKSLRKYSNVLAVYLFGSSVRGNTDKLSDTDIGVVFENPGRIFKNAEKSLKMYEDLFDVLACLTKNTNKMDLVFIQRAPLSLQKEAVSEGRLLYVKNLKRLLDYKEKVLTKYLDIKPLYNQFYQDVYTTRLWKKLN